MTGALKLGVPFFVFDYFLPSEAAPGIGASYHVARIARPGAQKSQ